MYAERMRRYAELPSALPLVVRNPHLIGALSARTDVPADALADFASIAGARIRGRPALRAFTTLLEC
jgi:hypothetical protein